MKNIKKIIYLFFLLIIFNTGFAAADTSDAPDAPDTVEIQEKAAHSRVGIGIGYLFAGYREETDIPLNRYVHTFAFALDGNFEKGRLLYSFNSNFIFGKNKAIEINSNENYFTYYQKESNFIKVSLENSLDYRLWGNNALPGYLGGALRCDVYFTHLPQTFYYNLTGIISLDIHLTQKWIINDKNTFAVSASIPVLGFGIRPPYYGLLYTPLDLTMSFVSLHNYWAIFCHVKYEYKLTRLISFYSNLGFEFSHINFPQPRRDASIRINAGVSFIF